MSLYPVSWTRLDEYLLCPFRYYHTKVAYTYVQGETEQMKWGNDVHKALENCTITGEPMEERYKQFQPLADKVNSMPGDHYVEQKLSIDANLQPVDYDDKANGYVRCIIDHLIILDEIAADLDYKTGKRKTQFSRQLTMSAGIVFAHFPQVEVVHAAYLWTQGGKPTKHTFKRNDMPAAWDCFGNDISNMQWSYDNDAWPCKPNGLCKDWCPVLCCLHNGRRKR